MKNTYLVIFRESTAECAPKAQPIYDFLETLEDWCKLKDGVYGIATELTKDEIEKYIKSITNHWGNYYIFAPSPYDYLMWCDDDIAKFFERNLNGQVLEEDGTV